MWHLNCEFPVAGERSPRKKPVSASDELLLTESRDFESAINRVAEQFELPDHVSQARVK